MVLTLVSTNALKIHSSKIVQVFFFFFFFFSLPLACQEDLFSSRKSTHLLDCGHALHRKCFKKLLHVDYRCPWCRKSMIDMQEQWTYFDVLCEAFNNPQVDEENEEMRENIDEQLLEKMKTIEKVLCNECEKYFEHNWSPFNLYKCGECGSYNCSL